MTANGQLADNQLVSFYGTRLAPRAAADGGLMVNAAARVGHVIRPLIVKDQASGYRSDAVQTAMHWAQSHGHAADYKLLASPPAPPLAPVGESRHGQGRACDWVWSSPAALAWLVAHGHEFGWTFWNRETDEPHMEHDAVHSVVTWTEPGLAPASTGSTPIGHLTDEDDMTKPTLYHEVTTHGDQAYLAQMPNSIQVISEDWAKAICKSQGIDFGSIPIISEFDLVPITSTLAADQAALKADFGTITITPAQVAAIGAAVHVDLSSLAAAITALDTQDDNYQAQLLATIAKGFVITGTAKQ